MSDLLNSASLVMIPSGYKEDVVYSQIPTDGSGDLSFTRASNGTRVNSAGLVEVAPWNLGQYSEEFNNAVYVVKNAVTIVDNSTTAPNGTTTADLIYPSSSGNYRYVAQAFTQEENIYTLSVYAKAQNKNVIWMYIESSSATGIVYFDLSDGTMSVTAGSVSTPIGTMTAVGNGWYRCIYTVGASLSLVSGSGFGVCDAKGSVYATASGTNGVYFWGYQLNIGSTAKPYFPTTDRLNVPRLTYQNGGGGCPSLLLEKQSTNYARNWNFAASNWSTSIVNVTANAGTSPDGTNNAFLIYPSTSGTNRFIYDDGGSAGYSANANYTTTVYAKAAGLNWAYIRFEDKTDNNSLVYFNLSTGVVGSTAGVVTIVSKTIESMGNGWYRLRVTANMSSGSGGRNNVLFGVADADASTQVTASGTNGVLFYGPQSEQSDYPTSPIQTSGSSATRVVDTMSRSSYTCGITSQATLFADFVYQNNGAAYSTAFLIYTPSLGHYIYLTVLANTMRLICVNGGVIQTNIISSSITAGTRYKVAGRFKTDDFALYMNGALIGTDTSGTMPTFSTSGTTSYLGNDASNTEPLGYANQLIVFPTALTNAELASLTTI